MEIDFKKVEVIEIYINTEDYPDFEDSYIVYAEYDGREMTDEEIEYLNNDADFLHEQILKELC